MSDPDRGVGGARHSRIPMEMRPAAPAPSSSNDLQSNKAVASDDVNAFFEAVDAAKVMKKCDGYAIAEWFEDKDKLSN